MTSLKTWPAPAVFPSLPEAEVHVWRSGLDLSEQQMERFQSLLSDDERERAARFRSEKDEHHFVAARGLLRTFLGAYLAANPKGLRFVYSEFGKPELALDNGGRELQFNLSHSHGLALFAFARGRRLGIDLELVSPKTDAEEIAGRFFAPGETEALGALPKEQRVRAFFNCWTRKEAFIKAQGKGLSLPLNQFEVTVAPGESPTLVIVNGDPEEAARWGLRGLEPAEDYAGTLVVEGTGWELKCWTLEHAEQLKS